MQNNQNPFVFLGIVAAIVIGSFALYVAENKLACECPRPAIHDNGDDFRPNRRPRRPDGSLGEVPTSLPQQNNTCPDGKCPAKDNNGTIKRDM